MAIQRNVQEQIKDRKAEIERTAAYGCSPHILVWLTPLLHRGNLMIKDGILVELSHMPVPDNCYSGLWLTKTKQFWEFDVVVESGNNELLDVERFENISERMRVSTHLRGMGYSFAAVALEILNQLKAAAATTDEEQIAEARLGYASLFGAGHGSFAMPEDVDTFLRQERYAWEK